MNGQKETMTTIEGGMDSTKETITITEAAARMGRGKDELAARMRYCAMNGISFPLGFAVPPPTEKGQWAYIIPRTRFERYMKGEDLNRPEMAV